MFTFCQTAAHTYLDCHIPFTHIHTHMYIYTHIYARCVLGLDQLTSTYFFPALFRLDVSNTVKVASSGLVVLDRPAAVSLWRAPHARLCSWIIRAICTNPVLALAVKAGQRLTRTGSRWATSESAFQSSSPFEFDAVSWQNNPGYGNSFHSKCSQPYRCIGK